MALGKVDLQSLKDFYNSLVQINLAQQVLPNFLGNPEKKQYLVILQDNRDLKPSGGSLLGLALLKVEKGKVSDVLPLSLSELDGKLPVGLVPEDLVKTNFKIDNLKLSNSNFDADFPTFAKSFESLYSQTGNGQVDGVLAFDGTAAQGLMQIYQI